MKTPKELIMQTRQLAVNMKIDKIIKDCGFFIQGVRGGEDTKDFLYTAGLTAQGLPEIFVPGSSATDGLLINELGKDMLGPKKFKPGVPYISGETCVRVNGELQDMRMRFDVATPDQAKFIKENCAFATMNRYADVSWVVLHYGDPSNKLPGEEGYVKCASFDFKE